MEVDWRTQSSYPLGLRNNNPGNLRPGDSWKGMIGENKGFIVFENVNYGLRALATDVSNKFFRGLNTITKIISVYAPPSENDTNAYINAVSSSTGISKDATINFSKDTLKKLVRAIVMHENGSKGSLITDQMIEDGISSMSSTLLLKIKGFSQPTRK